MRASLRGVKRLAVLVAGGTLCLFGLALLVLPGPGTLFLLLGLSLLATEFAWARRCRRKLRVTVRRAARRARAWRAAKRP